MGSLGSSRRFNLRLKSTSDSGLGSEIESDRLGTRLRHGHENEAEVEFYTSHRPPLREFPR